MEDFFHNLGPLARGILGSRFWVVIYLIIILGVLVHISNVRLGSCIWHVSLLLFEIRKDRSFLVGIAELILDSYPEFSDSPDADPFLVMIMAIYGEKQIGNQSGENLYHQPILCPCDQVIDPEVPLPPCKELFDLPAQFIDKSDLLGREIMAIGGYPVIYVIDAVSNKAEWLLCLVNTWGPEQNDRIVEDDAVGGDRVHLNAGYLGICLDTADEVLAIGLPFIKAMMGLIAPVHDTGLARRENNGNKGALTLLTIRKVDFGGNATVDIKPNMDFGLL